MPQLNTSLPKSNGPRLIWAYLILVSLLTGCSNGQDSATQNTAIAAPTASNIPASTPPQSLNASDNTLTKEEEAAGWQLLFDGFSMSHWRTYGEDEVKGAWQIINGNLVLTAKGGGDLITRKIWDNFELMLEWNISEVGNSGIFILADESDLPIYVHAPEIQLLDDARHADNKLASHRSGSLYDMIAAPPESQKPALQWNQLRIKYLDGQLNVWQNGHSTVDIAVGSARWIELESQSKFADWPGFGERTSGHIGLQDHGDYVAFKNMKIRPIASSQPKLEK